MRKKERFLSLKHCLPRFNPAKVGDTFERKARVRKTLNSIFRVFYA